MFPGSEMCGDHRAGLTAADSAPKAVAPGGGASSSVAAFPCESSRLSFAGRAERRETTSSWRIGVVVARRDGRGVKPAASKVLRWSQSGGIRSSDEWRVQECDRGAASGRN